MEKHLTTDQERLLFLQERSSFTGLNTEEQQFVLRFSTQEQFDQIHALLSESKHLYAIPPANNLILPQAQKNRVLPFLIPITSAAAAAILTFFFFQKETIIIQELDKPVYLTADTVYIQNERVDTIVKNVKTKENSQHAKSNSVTVMFDQRPDEIVGLSIPNIGLENKGQSAAKDKTIALIEGRGI